MHSGVSLCGRISPGKSRFEQHQVGGPAGSDPGTGEELLPELCSLLEAAAHQILPTVDLAHSSSMWRTHPRDTAPEL